MTDRPVFDADTVRTIEASFARQRRMLRSSLRAVWIGTALGVVSAICAVISGLQPIMALSGAVLALDAILGLIFARDERTLDKREAAWRDLKLKAMEIPEIRDALYGKPDQ